MEKLNFSRITSVIALPELLAMQKTSMAEFLQWNVSADKRKIQGLQAAFMDVFPVHNNDESLTLEFLSYDLGEPRYTEDEALAKDAIYSTPLKATFRILHKEESGKVKQIAEQDVYVCDIPLMTENATFIINGAERVVVSQLHRSPGVIFEEDEEKKISSYGKKLYFARMIPYRGAWVEFEFDLNNVIYVRLDKHKKLPATVLLRAMGYENDEDILQIFYDTETLEVAAGKEDQLVGRILGMDVILKGSGEVLFEANKEITKENVAQMLAKKVEEVSVLILDPAQNDVAIRNTLEKDNIKTRKEAISHIYRVLRAQEFIAADQAESYLDNLLFKSIRKYDLTRVGRYKINKKLAPLAEWLKSRKMEVPSERRRTLAIEDIIATLKYLILLNNDVSEILIHNQTTSIEMDDIDHLGNRRVRGVGELLENQIRIGLSQMARIVRERMNILDKATLSPRTIMNAAPVVAIVRKFFGSSQLSQFMDQTNPLAELTHKRRLSALGPGGLHRKRAGFEVRDVHHTHYGRICPIETPEGPNIGLISSLACYARVNEYGLVESPYRKVVNGKASEEVEYLTADVENDLVVAQANSQIDKNGKFLSSRVLCRHRGDFKEFSADEIDYMDISPIQVVSVSAALIPFLEHDDANRALMGSNMQRQAVPLLVTDAPLVGTGIEERVARDSGAAIAARRGGIVVSVSADEIAIYSDEPSVELANGKKSDSHIDVYRLKKYLRSNQDTTMNQVPLVYKSQKIKKGDLIADGPATSQGELALGRNLLVAFMPWEGCNFEDAILLSERVVRDDLLTSVHIHEFQMEARDTKMGAEEITRDIPNVGADSLIHLDEFGIVRPGAEVVPGDILVGKVAPKGEQQVTPEERLLKVIFGKKAEDTMDSSLRVSPGVSGKVIGVRMFVRREKLAAKEENKKIRDIESRFDVFFDELKQERKDRLEQIELQKEEKKISSKEAEDAREQVKLYCTKKEQQLQLELAREKENVKLGDELPVTVNKIVKVYIAVKRKIQVGDKLAGRHGNKGVVSRIVPQEDMPFLPDGTPVDVVLSPLGVPSRMNVGQLLETMLGWAAKILGVQMNTSVFDGAKEEQVVEMIRKAKDKLRKSGVPEEFLPNDYCKFQLFDGRNGEAFSERTTVGYMYIIKLHHLVEDKIHARSTGPYSLITRQPLGGKAQFGGQRFGEMEVWAIEAYGAAHCLQEFLTVKSDDVSGRAKMYEAIIKGESFSEPGVPESFKVLARELRALGLNIELVRTEARKDSASGKSNKKVSEEVGANS